MAKTTAGRKGAEDAGIDTAETPDVIHVYSDSRAVLDEETSEEGRTAQRARTERAAKEATPPLDPYDTFLVKGPPAGDKHTVDMDGERKTIVEDRAGGAVTGSTPSKFAIGAAVVVVILVLLALTAIF